MNEALNPNNTAFYELMTKPELSIKMGALFDSDSYTKVVGGEKDKTCRLGTVGSTVSDCTKDKWSLMWTRVFRLYNKDDKEYMAEGTSLNNIIKLGNQYEPRSCFITLL